VLLRLRPCQVDTRFKSDLGFLEYTITGDQSNLQIFHITDPVPTTIDRSGTDVEISNLLKDFRSLSGDRVLQAVAEHFALLSAAIP